MRSGGHNQIDWTNRTAFIGCWLAQAAEGRGTMTRSCAALIEQAFNEYQLDRLVMSVATENRKGQSIPERLGLVREEILKAAE